MGSSCPELILDYFGRIKGLSAATRVSDSHGVELGLSDGIDRTIEAARTDQRPRQ